MNMQQKMDYLLMMTREVCDVMGADVLDNERFNP